MRKEYRLAASLFAAAVLLVPFVSACSSSSGSSNDSVAPLALQVDGNYTMSMTWTDDQCTGSLAGSSESGVMEIDQLGDNLSGTLLDDCGDVEDSLSGSISGDSVQFAFTNTEVISPDCTLTTTGVASGTASGSGSTGTLVLTLNGAGTDCPKQVPCQVSGNFTLESCPPADCTPSMCGQEASNTDLHKILKND